MNRFEAFIKVIETGSFTKAAEELNYTQSAVSQMIHSLEEKLSTKLIVRSRKGIELTADGKKFLPYITSVHNAYRDLMEKKKEMQGLQSGVIRIGTFSSVSCNWLPELIRKFKSEYPSVQFVLKQGEYTSIGEWIKEGSVDFGFVNPCAVNGLQMIPLHHDELLAVLPNLHPLAKEEIISLNDLAKEPFILLDEGAYNEPLNFFSERGTSPNIQYQVYDDYTIMSMVENGLGVALLPKLVLSHCDFNIAIKNVTPPVSRTISLAYKDQSVLPIASRSFIDFIVDQYKNSKELKVDL